MSKFYKLLWEDFQKLKCVDPHFCKDCVSPLARFVPTEYGWGMALDLAALLNIQLSSTD